jgi:hypothetical protein
MTQLGRAIRRTELPYFSTKFHAETCLGLLHVEHVLMYSACDLVQTRPSTATWSSEWEHWGWSRMHACTFSEGPLEARCTRNLEKNRLLHEPWFHERSRTGWRRLWRHPRPQTWQARAWRGQRPTAPPSRAKTRLGREIWGHTFPRRGHPFPRRKSISRRGRQNAPPRSGETGGKGCRRAGRRGRHARADGMGIWESALTERTQPAPKTERTQPAPEQPGRMPDPAEQSAGARSPEIGRLNLWVGG